MARQLKSKIFSGSWVTWEALNEQVEQWVNATLDVSQVVCISVLEKRETITVWYWG